jgi:hypothetical protein
LMMFVCQPAAAVIRTARSRAFMKGVLHGRTQTPANHNLAHSPSACCFHLSYCSCRHQPPLCRGRVQRGCCTHPHSTYCYFFASPQLMPSAASSNA